jgi:hypothetical protein
MLLGLDAYAGPPTIINSGAAGILTDSNCDQAKYYSIGTLCQDTDDGKLYKGTGSGVEEIAAASLTPASTAEVAAGTVENKYVNPKELAGRLAVTEVDGHAAGALTAAQVTNTTIHNADQAASDVTKGLPTAAKDYRFVGVVATAQAGNEWCFQADTNDKVYLDGVAGSDNGKVCNNAPAVGHWIACRTFKSSASTYDWLCESGEGTWVAE